jgi:hypothetical protein
MDPPFFALVNLCALCNLVGLFPRCLLPFVANDTHIIGLAQVVS